MLTKQSEMQSQVILISSLNKGVLNSYLSLYFFLNGSHAAFGYELIIRSETADFMEIIRDKLPSV